MKFITWIYKKFGWHLWKRVLLWVTIDRLMNEEYSVHVDICEICGTKSEKLDVLTVGFSVGTFNKSGFIRIGDRVKVDERGVWTRTMREGILTNTIIDTFAGYILVGSCREELIRNVLES